MSTSRQAFLRRIVPLSAIAGGILTGILFAAAPRGGGGGPATPPAPPVITTRPAAPGAIKALFVSGGCCHDYKTQMNTIADGISKFANVEWTLVLGTGTTENYVNPFYNDPDWYKGYDIVIHDECSAAVKDAEYIRRVIKPHADGLPGVVLHCAMHTYRDAPTADEYREFLGVTTHNHEPSAIFDIKPVAEQVKHPIMIGFPETFKTPVNDELYIILKSWPNMTPIATGFSRANNCDIPCVWINNYKGKARVFGTTLGHSTPMVSNETYLNLLARGTLWAAGKLGDDGKPMKGFEAKPAN
jgi:type 1 glutamine amidotransferase